MVVCYSIAVLLLKGLSKKKTNWNCCCTIGLQKQLQNQGKGPRRLVLKCSLVLNYKRRALVAKRLCSQATNEVVCKLGKGSLETDSKAFS
jgi:hypothetical protein